MNELELPKISKLNTIELETWLDPYGKISDYCHTTISWDDFDKDEDFFSLENKKKAFWENYRDNNLISVEQSDWSIEEIEISTIINGGMWTGISSPDMVKAMNKLWFWGHLSSVWIGDYYFNKIIPSFNKLKKSEQKNIITTEFNKIFKEELKLSDEFIEKHFFKCEDLWEQAKNKWFNCELPWKAMLFRMKDLIWIYRETTKLKKEWINVWINCMYKTSSYIASLKIATLAWIDYITTAAGNPEKNPKEFLSGFYSDLDKEWIKYRKPAFWLLISSGNSRFLKDLDYDYYTFEEWDKAGWHIIRMWDKYEELEKIKKIFGKASSKMPPIYAAGWIYNNAEIKKALAAWFSWVQIWTNLAVSEEAIDGKWEEFKKTLISGNHLWPVSKIDEIAFNSALTTEKKIKQFERIYRKKVLKYLEKEAVKAHIEFNELDIEIVKNHFYKVIYNNFFNKEFIREEWEEYTFDQMLLYHLIEAFIIQKAAWNQEKMFDMLKSYGNSLKAIQEFKRFYEENQNSIPTHLVFDSTVGFPGRARLKPEIYKIILWKVESSGCVNCLTDCILAWRAEVKPARWSNFCIVNWLDKIKEKGFNLDFSGRSTVPYPEIRSLKDIMAYFMGYYVER